MTANPNTVTLQGSKKAKMPNATVAGEAPSEPFTVTVTVRPGQKLPSFAEYSRVKPRERTYLSREEHAKQYGADPYDIKKVESFAQTNGLKVVESSAAKRTIILSGTPSASRPVVMAKNPSNHVLVDLDVERQGDLLRDSRTAPVGIAFLHFDDRIDEFCTRSFRAGLPAALR